MCKKRALDIIASERHRLKQYQKLLNRQLEERINSIVDKIENISEPDELDDILEERDTLEYARMGIHVIQMQGRLVNVDYGYFTTGLKRADQLLRQVFRDNQDVQKPPYAPSTFWWRR